LQANASSAGLRRTLFVTQAPIFEQSSIIMAGHSADPLDHVIDHPTIEIPWVSPPKFEWAIPLPEVAGFQITRFMVMELIAAVLLVAIMIPLVRHVARTPVSRGLLPNIFEVMLLFIRDQVVRPAIGGHAADHFLPFLWTVFFFVLFNNLLGMIPGCATATGNVNVTAVLALSTFVVVVGAGMREMGVAGYWLAIVPHLDVPGWLKPPLWVLMFFIEVAGLLIRHVVLAVRLFANMFAGHVVLSAILGFILMAWSSHAFYLVMPLSIGGLIAVSMLELLFAFIQAYVFTFLASLFIGAAVHPH
jgi:F-type H+-transporting ATPase subunit a